MRKAFSLSLSQWAFSKYENNEIKLRNTCTGRGLDTAAIGCHEIPRFWEIPRLVSLSQIFNFENL
jgi:hypothetical protein